MGFDPLDRPPIRDPAVLRRMQIAFDLFDTAVKMKRQNILRQDPDATEEDIREGIRKWLHHRPGAEHGDGVGRPASPERLARLRGESSPDRQSDPDR